MPKKDGSSFSSAFQNHVENEHRYDKSQSPPVINRRTFSDIFHHTTSFRFFYSTFIPYNNKILFIYMKYSFKKYILLSVPVFRQQVHIRAKKTLPFRERPFPCCKLFQNLSQHPDVLAETCNVIIHQSGYQVILLFLCRFLDSDDFFKKILEVRQHTGICFF